MIKVYSLNAGYIHFWNVYNSSGPMGHFPAVSQQSLTVHVQLESSAHNCMSVFCSHELILLVHLQTLSSHVTALAVDSNNTVLVSGDLHGMNIIIQPIMLQEVITILQLYLYGYLRLLSV